VQVHPSPPMPDGPSARFSNTVVAWAEASRCMHKWKINVQRSRRDVGADRGERPAPVSPCNLLTTTMMPEEDCHVNTIKVNTISDRCGRFQVRRGSAHDGASILSYRPIASQTGRPCAIGLCTLSTSFSRSDHAVGLVHTLVQHKGKTHLESESSGKCNPHLVQNRTSIGLSNQSVWLLRCPNG
jgi:hypothetical protein